MEHFLRYQAARRITLVGAAVNVLLAIIKIVGGVLGHSQALLADGIHSLSDLLTDILVLFAAKYGNQGADADHPYGHRRIETAATVALALILITVGVLIIVNAGTQLLSGRPAPMPHAIAFWIAVVSIVANELLFRSTLRVAEKIKSDLLRANAWHHRSDAASSLVVVIGIGGALLGYSYLDSIAAILVGILIIKMGAELAWTSIRELVDTGLDSTMLANIQRVIKETPGVKAIHQLRTRTMGSAILVDVHIQVDPYLTVSEGHFIGQQVHYGLMRAVGSITDVTVHVDPEDDEIAAPATKLPPRDVLLPELENQWRDLPGAEHITQVSLHYLNGKIHVEIGLPAQLLKDTTHAQHLTELYQNAIRDRVEISSVRLIFYLSVE